MDYYCTSKHPQVNKMIISFAKERGMDVTSCGAKFNRKFPHISFDETDELYQSDSVGHKGLTIEEFINKLTEFTSNPKIAGHTVKFHKDKVEVGCTSITIKEVDNFFAAYKKHYKKK